MKLSEIVSTDPETMSGTPVFSGTRVPVWSLFVHLEKGISLDVFLEDFPTVQREQATGLLELAEKSFMSKKNIELIYESAACA